MMKTNPVATIIHRLFAVNNSTLGPAGVTSDAAAATSSCARAGDPASPPTHSVSNIKNAHIPLNRFVTGCS
jgi:hypothetical protein